MEQQIRIMTAATILGGLLADNQVVHQADDVEKAIQFADRLLAELNKTARYPIVENYDKDQEIKELRALLEWSLSVMEPLRYPEQKANRERIDILLHGPKGPTFEDGI